MIDDVPGRCPLTWVDWVRHALKVPLVATPVSPLPPTSPTLAPAYWFSVFNALSFQIALAGPMLLFAKSLGASATVLGLLGGMMPLLTVAQIPAAQFISRVGYKQFVIGGWSLRVLFIFALALIPLGGGFLDDTTRLVLLLAVLFGFNLARGISSCAWLPWITILVPPEIRGRYLAADQLCMNAGSGLAFLLAAGLLAWAPSGWGFAVAFLFSAVMGSLSLIFLRRMPDVPVPPGEAQGVGPVPWLTLARYPPFCRLLRVNVAWSIAYGGLGTFAVDYLKSGAGFAGDSVLLLMSASFAGGMSSYWLTGSRLDRLGSKPVLVFAAIAGALTAMGWFAVAARIVRPTWGHVLPLTFALGLLNSVFAGANFRLASVIVPPMGRVHFFALFSVVWQLTLGLAPLLWGLLIDALATHSMRWAGIEWNRYSWYFGLSAAVFCVMWLLAGRVEEPKAARFEVLLREMLLDHPQRLLVRWLGRM